MQPPVSAFAFADETASRRVQPAPARSAVVVGLIVAAPAFAEKAKKRASATAAE